ncbi:MAG: putative MATE family efflux protein [Saprospiraceae bacterium]|jgi:putative MATE family efflux protein
MSKPNRNSEELGTKEIGPLLVKMGVPASIGILVMSIYMIVDTIFIGRYVGTSGIAAVTVVMPIIFTISSIGMAIGIGGSSVISRALGANRGEHAQNTFGNMISLTVILSIIMVAGGYYYDDEILTAFGARGDILPPAKEFFNILLPAIPCLAFGMMSNNVIRSQGDSKTAMVVMLVPAVMNIILDPIFMVYYEMGMAGAAWATTISYFFSASFALWYFFLSGRSDLKIHLQNFILKLQLVKEIFEIGFVTFARQGTIALLMLVLNNTLGNYGGETAVAMFGIMNRISMFANFPVLGVTQGFLPIAGYNYGAAKYERVKDTIALSIKTGTMIAVGMFVLMMLFREELVGIFTTDTELLTKTPAAFLIVFLGLPTIQVQLISSAYFQAIGKAMPALLLTLTKQGFFLIPLILILPLYFGLNGVWMSFPIADTASTLVSYWYLKREMRLKLEPMMK